MESDLLRKYICSLNVSFVVVFFFFSCLVAKLCPTVLQPHGPYPTRLLYSWDFPGKNMSGYSALEQMEVNFNTQFSSSVVSGSLRPHE